MDIWPDSYTIKMIDMKTYLLNGLFLLAVCLSSACTEKTLNKKSDGKKDFPTLSAMEIFDNLDASFEAEMPLVDSGGTPIRSAGTGIHPSLPDFYGGGYYDAEGHAVVLVKGDPDAYLDEIRVRTKSNNVIVQRCDYAYNELVALNDSLGIPFEDEALCRELGWTGSGIDSEKNRVMVGLLPLTEKAKRRFKEWVCSSGAIEFEEGGVSVLDAAANLAGTISHLKFNASIGYRAKNAMGASGFVTAGHLFHEADEAVFIKGSYGADCRNTQYSGSIDAAFCQLRKGYYISNRTEYRGVVINARCTPLKSLRKNTLITMEGFSTAKASTGAVIRTDARQKFANRFIPGKGYVTYTISNLILSTYSSTNGDSGGIVYEESTKNIVGIHTGRFLQNKQFKGSFTSYAGYINQAFNLVLE